MDKQIADITSKVQSINIKETLDKKFCDLVFSLLGKQVKVKLPDNQEGEGIFYTINPKNGGVMIKNYKEQVHCYPGEENQCKKQNQNDSNITKCLLKQDFVYLFAEDVEDPPYIQDFKSIQKDTKNLKTDAELTKLDKNREREFQAVNFIFDNGESIEDGEDLNQKAKVSSYKNLDQFQINQQKFGVGTEFKDEFYTTKLDISKFDKKQIEQAEKLEQEVNKEGSKYKHVLIDRGRDDLLADSDEEKYFSAVDRPGRFNSDQNNQKGSKKDISSQTKIESKENQGISDEIKFGQGRRTFTNKLSKQELQTTSKESEQTKKEDNQVKDEASNSKKEETLPVIQSKASQENNQEQKKQITNTKQNDTNKSNSQSIVFVEKVDPPVQEQPTQKDSKNTATLSSQIQPGPQLVITNNNNTQKNGNQNGENNKTTSLENQTSQKTQEQSEKDKQAQQPQTLNDQNSQFQQQQNQQAATNTNATTTNPPQSQAEKPKVRKQLKIKDKEFKLETQQQETTNQNQNYQDQPYSNQQQNEQSNYIQLVQPMIQQSFQQPIQFFPQIPPFGMTNQYYPQQIILNQQHMMFQTFPQQQQQYSQGQHNKQTFKKPQGQQ
ncbi:hypothetical protein ABPG72_016338 [Tetrahymena utriculariae]